ncbi:MAG: preprotein translocase subunit SecG [Candidatus Omnitrophota bacterium]
MIGFLFGIHVFICAALIVIILIQAGRGGGLVEGFSGVESMFGTKTSAFLTKATTILSTLFFISCLSLAFLSARQSRSLMKGLPKQKPVGQESQSKDAEQAKPQEEKASKTKEDKKGPVQEKTIEQKPVEKDKPNK